MTGYYYTIILRNYVIARYVIIKFPSASSKYVRPSWTCILHTRTSCTHVHPHRMCIVSPPRLTGRWGEYPDTSNQLAEFFFMEVILHLSLINVSYFHFMGGLKLLASHKCYSPVQIRDSIHAHFLMSFQ